MSNRVLILGSSRGPSFRIAEEFKALGFEVLLPGLSDDRLPRPHERDALKKMSEALERHRDGATWLHPGLSAWAERSEIVALGNAAGMNVISPSAKVLSLFANKLSLLQKGEELGIPNLMLDPEPMHSLREIENFISSKKLKFPFVMKTAKGGSRFGLSTFHDASELESKLPLWLDQLRATCGEVILFAEKYLEGSRLISVPFVRFQDGRRRCFPIIDASLQCRHRKVIEFCPAPQIREETRREIESWTLALAQSTGYVGVGALEFLIENDRAYLIGGAPRLQASFHLWEKVEGTEAIAWQVCAAYADQSISEPASNPEPSWRHAVTLRLYAEDAVLQLPQPGTAEIIHAKEAWDFQIGGAELEMMIRKGEKVSPAEQGWIGTLYVGAREQSQCMKLAKGVLEQVWIAGSLQTNERFLAELIQHPWIKEGIFHTGFIDEEFVPALRPAPEILKVIAAALESAFEAREGFRWAVGDQWVKPDPKSLDWVEGPSFWDAGELKGVSGTLRAQGRTLLFCAYPISENRWQCRLAEWSLVARRVPPKSGVKPRPHISALIPGKIHSILYREGASISAHEPLLIVQSLGMLVPHALPVDVKIERWKVRADQDVHAGQELAEFEILAKS